MNELGRATCRALGIDADDVVALRIDSVASEPETVTITSRRYPTDAERCALVELLEQFEIVRHDDEAEP